MDEQDTQVAIDVERERIARAGAEFFQNGEFNNWVSPTGRNYEDLGNGWTVGYDLMVTIMKWSDLVHAEYQHKPDEKGIFTVCGIRGTSEPNNLDKVTCTRCLDIMKQRGFI